MSILHAAFRARFAKNSRRWALVAWLLLCMFAAVSMYVPFRLLAARYNPVTSQMDFCYTRSIFVWPTYFFLCAACICFLGRWFRVRWFIRLPLLLLFVMSIEQVVVIDDILGITHGLTFVSCYVSPKEGYFNTTQLSLLLLWPFFVGGVALGEFLGWFLLARRLPRKSHEEAATA